ncbi:MAG TPA: peptidoglycan DD-metalloendopeptidase family protein [Candidatus Pacearchaeota archaeon]|nr:peptidoglycan DD-metalloendopeptidase family protein [Candidatus Pacearchaeota archaeon]
MIKRKIYKFFRKKRVLVLLLAGIIIASFNISAASSKRIIELPEKAFVSLEPEIMAPIKDINIEDGIVLSSINSPLFVNNISFGTKFTQTDEEKLKKDIIYHLVKEGETLLSIAEKYNISLETVLLANEINKNTVIKPGQKLIILPTEGLLHMVERGDTVSSIAKKYQSTSNEIIAFNELSNASDIYVGDILFIPNGKMPKIVNTTPSTTKGYINIASNYFISPAKGIITNGLHYYNAIDIANSKGSPIVAAAAGVVQTAKYAWPSGNYVTILHPNGVVTYYGHLSYWTVTPGQQVAQGQVIGYMGNTGLCISLGGDGSHLHFDVRGATNPLAKYKVGTKVSY